VSNGSETREIAHFWFDAWPDHGVPRRTDHVVKMLQAVRSWSNHPSQPWVVHCSAGIGRTGTFIAIDHGLKLLRERGRCDVLEIIRRLRKDRGGMVQHAEQGEFVHRTLTGFIKQASMAAVIDDCDNDVLRKTLTKAFDVVPPSFTVHPSQVEGDEGDDTSVPAYRQKQLLAKERRTTEESDMDEPENTGGITNAAKRKLKRGEEKRTAIEARRKAMSVKVKSDQLPDVETIEGGGDGAGARSDAMSPTQYNTSASRSSVRFKSRIQNAGARPGQVMEAGKQQKGFKLLRSIGEHTHTMDVSRGARLTVINCLTEDWCVLAPPGPCQPRPMPTVPCRRALYRGYLHLLLFLFRFILQPHRLIVFFPALALQVIGQNGRRQAWPVPSHFIGLPKWRRFRERCPQPSYRDRR
jgi:hypothetical protein